MSEKRFIPDVTIESFIEKGVLEPYALRLWKISDGEYRQSSTLHFRTGEERREFARGLRCLFWGEVD